ncbi:MAG: type I CRISPR-associated protein Cas7, partial [Parabacteroides sp.]|nr:type I CRISPR-associated protein Cas7 [Parabacteroides sp.]
VYATDKSYKYPVKNYLKDVYNEETIFYFKSLNKQLNPISLDETYKKYFGDYPKEKGKTVKAAVAKNLLSCLDIRLFGATYAGKEVNISIHGTVQVNHGVNIWKENNIFAEQISSPFANKSEDADAEKGMTTLGRQSRLEEGHYLHHFSVNPSNLNEITSLVENAQAVSTGDIAKLKEAMQRGVTFYDSASKAGCENEMLVWVQLKENSKAVLPNFTTLITLEETKENGKYVYDFAGLKAELERVNGEIEKIEVFYNKQTCLLKNLPAGTTEIDL